MTAEFFRGAKQADFSRVKAIIICAYAHSNANSGTFISACRMCLLALPQYPTLHSISNVSKASKPALGATAAKVRFVPHSRLCMVNSAAPSTNVQSGEATRGIRRAKNGRSGPSTSSSSHLRKGLIPEVRRRRDPILGPIQKRSSRRDHPAWKRGDRH